MERKSKEYYKERNLLGIRKVTEQKSQFQLNRTFERMMAKTKKEIPAYINGQIMWGTAK